LQMSDDVYAAAAGFGVMEYWSNKVIEQ
jgi:hypothetical protein